MRNNLLWGVAAVALIAPMGAMAQETTSTIRGTVTAGGAPVAGVLAAPALEEEFHAVLGGSSFRNDLPIEVTSGRRDGQLLIAADETLVKNLEPTFRDGITRVRHVPSLAYRLAMVADGRIDGTIVKRNSHDWDLAAADLILERAGGLLTDLDGRRIVYNREEPRHEMLLAGARHALESLHPHFPGSAPG